MLTKGVFGTPTIETYEGMYVRVAKSQDESEAASIHSSTPCEKLTSITLETSAKQQPDWGNAVLGSLVSSATSTLLKGSSTLIKGLGLGIAMAGMGHFATQMTGKCVLAVVTNRELRTLTNQKKNGVGRLPVSKDHENICHTLERVGNGVLSNAAAALE